MRALFHYSESPASPATLAVDPDVLGNRVLRSTISNYFGKLAWLLSGFLLTPFILRHLGPTDFGIWALAGTVVAYGSVLDFGIAGALVKYVAEYRAKSDITRLRSMVASALSFYVAVSLIPILLAAAAAPLFPVVFNVPAEKRFSSVLVVFIMGAGLGISIPATLTTSVLRGLQRYDLVSLLSTIGTILYTAAVVVTIHYGGGLVSLAVLGCIITLVMQAPAVWAIRRVAPELTIHWRDVQRSSIKTLASFSSWLFLQDIVGRLQNKSDEVIIGAWMPLQFVTPYSIVRRLSELCQIATDQFLKVLIPLASELNAVGDLKGLRELYVTASRLTMALFLAVGCMLAMLMKPLLTAWVGASYAAYSPIGIILLIAGFIDTTLWPAGAVLQGVGRYKPMVLMSTAAAVANIGLSIMLVRKIGLFGVALSTLIATALVCLLLVLPYALREMEVSPAKFLREVVSPAIIPAVPTIALSWLLTRLIMPASWIGIAAVSVSGCTVYGLFYVGLSASDFERHVARGLFARHRRAGRAAIQSRTITLPQEVHSEVSHD